MLELCIVGEDIESKRVITLIDEVDCCLKVIDGDYGYDRTKRLAAEAHK